jgi:hypothetical protein
VQDIGHGVRAHGHGDACDAPCPRPGFAAEHGIQGTKAHRHSVLRDQQIMISTTVTEL